MNWVVDRRKDNYDELLMLARDSRASRARTNRWTTGLIVGAIAASGVYVATVNQQVDNIRETAVEAEQQRDELRTERDLLKANFDALEQKQKIYSEMVPALVLGEKFKDLDFSFPMVASGDRAGATSTTVTQFALSNVVWVVDGSRRVPMTDGDILWIPEGGFWIRLESTTVGGVDQHNLTRHDGDPAGAASVGTPMTLPHREIVRRGSNNCVEINLHDESVRPGFIDSDYVDVEILYTNNSACAP